MAQQNDINVKIGAEGEGKLLQTLGRLRAASARVRAPMSADLNNIRAVASGVSKISIAAAGISAAGIASIVASLKEARNIANETSQELTELGDIATGLHIKSAVDAGALAFSGGLAGWDGLEDLRGIGGALQAAALDVKDGNEDIVAAFGSLGVHFEDLFKIDKSAGDYRAELRGIDEILRNISMRTDKLSEQNLAEMLIPIVGETDAQRLSAFLKIPSEELAKQAETYRRLTGMRDADIASSSKYQASLARTSTSLLGLRVAFTRDLYPALEQSNDKFAEFTVRNQSRFQAFGAAIGDYMGEIEPALIHSADLAMAVLSGDASAFADSPMKSAFESLVQLVKDFSQGVLDLLHYLNSGETNAEWLQNTLKFLAETRDAAAGLVGTIRDDIIPAVSNLIGWIDDLMTSLGVGETGEQLAIVGALVLFGNTISGLVGTVASLAGGLLKLSGAASKAAGVTATVAGGVGLGGVVAAGAGLAYAGMDSFDAAEKVDVARGRAEELAETHGEAYAAAYMRAVLSSIEDENVVASFMSNAAGWLGFSDGIGSSKAELDAIIKVGADSDALAGAAAAFADFGWPVENGTVEIGAGITVDNLTLSNAVQDRLNEISASLAVPDLPAAAAAQLGNSASAQKTPVILQLPTGERVDGLSASDDAIARLSRSATLSQRARS